MNGWNSIIKAEQLEPYFKQIVEFVLKDSETHKVFPPQLDILNAFKYCPLEKVRAVVIAQDPYSNEGQAHGLSFSVKPGVSIPPSLRNIYKELKDDLGIDPPNHGHLLSWSRSGVLLLNSALSVREGQPGSHMEIWQPFTDKMISVVNELDRPVVYILLGKFAQGKSKLITNTQHKIITGGHPSPLSSRLFFGGKYFSQANEFLKANGQEEINWKIDPL